MTKAATHTLEVSDIWFLTKMTIFISNGNKPVISSGGRIDLTKLLFWQRLVMMLSSSRVAWPWLARIYAAKLTLLP